MKNMQQIMKQAQKMGCFRSRLKCIEGSAGGGGMKLNG
jgi:hypothetical protein